MNTSNLRVSSPALRDVMRGLIWEEKYRGRLEDYPGFDGLRERAGELWKVGAPADFVLPRPDDWPVCRVGFGTYRWKYDPEVVLAAVRGGARLIDTAEGYGYGRVEENLGKIRGLPASVWFATKAARNHLGTAAVVSAALRSRDRLRRETIDLYQIHWPVMELLPRTMDGIADLIADRVIRRVGVCNFSAFQLAAARLLARERGLRIDSNQIRFHKGDRGAAEYLIPYCQRIGVIVIGYSPLGQGAWVQDAGLALRWALCLGADYVIPATNNMTHAEANGRIGIEAGEG